MPVAKEGVDGKYDKAREHLQHINNSRQVAWIRLIVQRMREHAAETRIAGLLDGAIELVRIPGDGSVYDGNVMSESVLRDRNPSWVIVHATDYDVAMF